MCSILTICSRFNRNLIRNLFVGRYALAHKVDKVKTVYVQLANPIRLYSVDAHNIQNKETWYANEENVKKKQILKNRSDHWKRLKVVLIFMCSCIGFSFLYLVYSLGSPNLDGAGVPIEDEFSQLPIPLQFLKRMVKELETLKRIIRQPFSQKLLPDPPVYPYYQPRYTLVLEMNHLLLHPDWTFQRGWRFKKRPGVNKFLELVTVPNFELVVFTGEQTSNTIPLLDALDPNGFIIHRLTRDSTEFVDGVYVKNLDYLNRDLSKVIVVDWNKDSVKFHPENTIIIPRWNGQDDDTMLAGLAAFLKAITSSDVDDVRDILSEYTQYDNPVEAFRENQRKLFEDIEKEKELKRTQGTNFASMRANEFLKIQRT